MTYQTIWIVEFSPYPTSSVGGFNWYFKYQDAIDEFDTFHVDGTLESHQVGIYSVRLPADWSRDQIQQWGEDHYNILPAYDPLAPAQAGDDK